MMTRRGRRKAPATANETTQILPKETNENLGRKGEEWKVKQALKDIGGQVCGLFTKRNSHPTEEQFSLLQEHADQNLDDFVEEGKFLEACKLIHRMDKEEKEKERFYEQVACRMRPVLRQALFGEENVYQQLRSIMAAVKWEETPPPQETVKNNKDTKPALKLSEQLENHIKEEVRRQISRFPAMDTSDGKEIEKHLEDLKSVLLKSVVVNRPLEEVGLLNIYARSFQHCMLSHISDLISVSCSPKECMRLFRWGSENYKSALLEALDRSLYSDWISTNLKKLIDVIQKDIKEKLNNILNREKELLSKSPEDVPRYHFSEICQVFRETLEEIQSISSTNLTNDVQAVCLQELLEFVSSYEHFIKSLLGPGQCSGTWTYRELRVIEDCWILRDTWHKLAQLCTAPDNMNMEVEKSINTTEDQGRNCFLQTLSSNFKETLKNHFRDDSDDFYKTLQYLNQRLRNVEGSKTESYKSLVMLAHHRVVVEYLRAFLTSAGRFKFADLHHFILKIERDGKTMQDLFQRCLNPAATALENPITCIIELLQATDLETIKMEAFAFIENHPDLRKEHLNVILDIKGTVRRRERNIVLGYLNCRATDEDHQMHFFEGIEVKRLWFAGSLCLCCRRCGPLLPSCLCCYF